MSIKNCNDTIGNRTRDLPACSAVPQLRYRVPPKMYNYVRNIVRTVTAVASRLHLALDLRPFVLRLFDLTPFTNLYHFLIFAFSFWVKGHAVAQLVEALRIKPEDHVFNSRGVH
jgi:hypothetical protein